MATFKYIVLAHHKKQDGAYNVKIRITHQRKTKYISTSTFVFKENMTKSLKIKEQNIIHALEDQIRLYYDYISELGSSINYMSIDEVSSFIDRKDRARVEGDNPKVNFYEYVDSLIEEMKGEDRKSSASNYNSMKNSLRKFHPNVLYFSDINSRFLVAYEKNMNDVQLMGKRGQSLYPALIRSTFNKAIKELNDYEDNIIRIKNLPFSKYEVPKQPVAAKRALSINKIKEIYNLTSLAGRESLAKDVFMLSFYLCGMNSVDLYNCDKYEEGRIIYNRQKTQRRRKDNAKMSVKVPKEAKDLFNKYKDCEKGKVFIFNKLYASHRTFNSAINIGLNAIKVKIKEDSLQFYAARHSFATIARNNCKLPMDYVSQALNHSLPQFETTDFYIAEDWGIVDEVQQKVIEKLLETENEIVDINPKK